MFPIGSKSIVTFLRTSCTDDILVIEEPLCIRNFIWIQRHSRETEMIELIFESIGSRYERSIDTFCILVLEDKYTVYTRSPELESYEFSWRFEFLSDTRCLYFFFRSFIEPSGVSEIFEIFCIEGDYFFSTDIFTLSYIDETTDFYSRYDDIDIFFFSESIGYRIASANFIGFHTVEGTDETLFLFWVGTRYESSSVRTSSAIEIDFERIDLIEPTFFYEKSIRSDIKKDIHRTYEIGGIGEF